MICKLTPSISLDREDKRVCQSHATSALQPSTVFAQLMRTYVGFLAAVDAYSCFAGVLLPVQSFFPPAGAGRMQKPH